MTASRFRFARISAVLTALSCLATACGTATATGSPTGAPIQRSTSTATITTITAPPSQSSALLPTPQQSLVVGQAVFPAVTGGYLECDHGSGQVDGCPLSRRLTAEIAHYASNYAAQCPGGCGGALLFIRDQCGPFPSEAVQNVQNGSIAMVNLSGDTSCRGVDKTFYVSVIIENGKPVADDVYCNIGDSQYGMYNPDPSATYPVPCPSS